MFKAALKFLAETIVRDTLSSAGQNIGEAIGKRIGKKIYVEPEPEKDGAEEKPAETT